MRTEDKKDYSLLMKFIPSLFIIIYLLLWTYIVMWNGGLHPAWRWLGWAQLGLMGPKAYTGYCKNKGKKKVLFVSLNFKLNPCVRMC